MFRKTAVILPLLIVVVLAAGSAGAGDPQETIQAMFVQNAYNVSFQDGRLTLERVSPTTIFFSDRPERVAGHMTTTDFVAHWGEGEDSFAADPPNAALSIFTDDAITDAIVTLRNPRLEGTRLIYDVSLLDGQLPPSGGECTLFIDPIGMPATPTSVAGHRRRVRRHVVHRW